jgi:hypothetical protein
MNLKRLLSRSPRKPADAPMPDPEEGSEPSPRASGGGLSVARLGLLSAIISVVVLAVVAALSLLQLQTVAAEIDERLHTEKALQSFARLAGRFEATAETVHALAADPAVVAAARGADAAALAAVRSRVEQVFPGALRVLLLRPTDQDPDERQTPSLGYACLDMARVAEVGSGRPPVEVHQFGTDDQHIDLAAPVRADGDHLATLLVSLDVGRLKGWMKTAVGPGAFGELRQKGAGAVLVASAGDAAAKQGGGATVQTVDGSSLELSIWAGAEPPLSEARTIAFLAPFAVGGIALLAVGAAIAFTARRLLAGDLLKLVRHFVDVFNNKRSQSLTLRLADTQLAVQMLDESLPVRPREQHHFEPRAVPAPPSNYTVQEGDGPEDVMFLDKQALVVEENAPAKER